MDFLKICELSAASIEFGRTKKKSRSVDCFSTFLFIFEQSKWHQIDLKRLSKKLNERWFFSKLKTNRLSRCQWLTIHKLSIVKNPNHCLLILKITVTLTQSIQYTKVILLSKCMTLSLERTSVSFEYCRVFSFVFYPYSNSNIQMFSFIVISLITFQRTVHSWLVGVVMEQISIDENYEESRMTWVLWMQIYPAWVQRGKFVINFETSQN